MEQSNFDIGYSKLNTYQKDIFDECILRSYGGLSLPLGSGKTLLALVLSLYYNNGPILIVVSKSLLGSWEFEIKKFFGDNLKYEVIHNSVLKTGVAQWKLDPDTSVVLTTIDTLADSYRMTNIRNEYVEQRYNIVDFNYRTEYNIPNEPFLNHYSGKGIFYSIEWGCFIVDEVQKYTNIKTIRCQSLGAICSQNRWVLSGTIFDEPKIERILGYYMILNVKGKPRNMPDMVLLLASPAYPGLNETLVHRKKNLAFIEPKVNSVIIKHELEIEEMQLYTMLREVLLNVKKKCYIAKMYQDTDEVRKLNSYMLVMIMYIRQLLICPIIPLTSISINVSTMTKKSELSTMLMNEVNALGLENWLDSERPLKSSRTKKILECITKHKMDKIIIFTCFNSFLDILQYTIKKDMTDITLFRMTSSMSSKTRTKLINTFHKSVNGVLLITYQLGAEGLNLQFASTVFLVDFWWNAAKEQQAIGRIFRLGQLAETINIYFFISNTGIEDIIFKKQKSKLNILEQLKTGNIKSKIPVLKMNDVIKMIELSNNVKSLQSINYI